MDSATFGDRVKQARMAKGLTLKYVALKVGVSEATVQRYECGSIKNPKQPSLIKLAKALDVDINYLMNLDTKKTTKTERSANMDKPWREKDYLTANDITEILGIHRNTAYDMIRTMPHLQLGHKKVIRVSRAAFEQWLKNQERANT